MIYTHPFLHADLPMPASPKPLELPASAAAAARYRSAAALRGLQRKARQLAEFDYIDRNRSGAVTVTTSDRKKLMRNKGAFVSRQTQRHYGRLLAEHLQQTERERDAEQQQILSAAREIEMLQAQAEQLAEQLSKQTSLCSKKPSTGMIRNESSRIFFDECMSKGAGSSSHCTSLSEASPKNILQSEDLFDSAQLFHQIPEDLPHPDKMSLFLDQAIGIFDQGEFSSVTLC